MQSPKQSRDEERRPRGPHVQADLACPEDDLRQSNGVPFQAQQATRRQIERILVPESMKDKVFYHNTTTGPLDTLESRPP